MTTFYRHEVPVADSRIRVIRMTEDLVVVDKPASIPVHPCGRYRHNTVVFILAKEQGLKNLRTIHRYEQSSKSSITPIHLSSLTILKSSRVLDNIPTFANIVCCKICTSK